MKGKRTGIDFANHNIITTSSADILVHHLKKPDTVVDNIKFINTNGILAVTGDYGNWIFCREFHPSADGGSDDMYWKEKLKILSCQEPSKYDAARTEERIKEMLADPEREWNDKDKEYLTDILTEVDDELDYTYHAYRDMPSNWDYEMVPFVKTVSHWFLAVLDGFDEICRRMKQEKERELARELEA